MLSPEPHYVLADDEDRKVFDTLVPPDHYLRRAAAAIDFERFRPLTAACYHPTLGRPAIEPVVLLKLEFMKYHDRLSDVQVIAQAQVNIAYREFLGLSLKSDLPDASTLCRFRGRLGVEGFRRIFDDVVAQAREHGLVKDRLRLKDATHVIADVAIPSTIQLVAGMRDRLLSALAAFDPVRVEGERVAAETIRANDAGVSPEQRLQTRVTHLRELSDPEGLDVEVFVPPVIPPESAGFTPEDFTLDEAGTTLTCPAGRQTTCRFRNRHDTGWTYQFSAKGCQACPLRTQCFAQPSARAGRRVNKGDYVAEYRAVRQKAQTPEYQEVRRTHPKVERKLGEIVRHHGGRRARYRGKPKVLIQELMTTLVVNVRRMAQLLCAEPTPCAV